MKKSIVLLTFILFSINQAFSQQKAKTRHMVIAIEDNYTSFNIGKKENNMIITRDDTAQLQKHVELNLHVKANDRVAVHENQMMQMLKPYYDSGWKLVSASTEVISTGGSPVEVFRYFFTREE
jgi:hypothetical protein